MFKLSDLDDVIEASERVDKIYRLVFDCIDLDDGQKQGNKKMQLQYILHECYHARDMLSEVERKARKELSEEKRKIKNEQKEGKDETAREED